MMNLMTVASMNTFSQNSTWQWWPFDLQKNSCQVGGFLTRGSQ